MISNSKKHSLKCQQRMAKWVRRNKKGRTRKQTVILWIDGALLAHAGSSTLPGLGESLRIVTKH